MKVLHFCMSRGWGGLEMASYQWARLFQEHGDMSYSMAAPDSPLARKLKAAGLHCEEREFRNYFSPRQTWRLRRFVIENGIEAVFLQSLKDLWLVSPALYNLPVKLVGFAQMWLQGITKKDFLHSRIYDRLDLLVTLTPRQGESILAALPVERERTMIVPNSIDTRRFTVARDARLRAELGADPDDVLIGIVGRLDPQKGQKELLQAFAMARDQQPHLKLKLVLIGEPTKNSGENFYAELKALVARHKMENLVRFMGFRDDVPQVMANLDVFVLNSYQEAFGFVVIEAMASGVPVIATNSGGVPDILKNGEMGLLVPPRDPQNLAQALLRLAADSGERENLKNRALSHVRAEYDELRNFEKMRAYLTGSPL